MAAEDIKAHGWTWSPSIGLYYGEGPNGEREQVHQPLMTSPWVVIASEYQKSLPHDRTGEPGEGTFVQIFPTFNLAMKFVADEHTLTPVKDFEVNSWKQRFGRDIFDVKIDGVKVAEDVEAFEVRELFSDYLKRASI